MLSKEQIEQWHTKGYVAARVIEDRITTTCSQYMTYNPSMYKDFGSKGKYEFPSLTCLDAITMDENLIKTVQQLLEDDIILCQSDAWTKWSDGPNADQRMHMDYGNNTFLHPRWDTPEAVAAIVYLSDTRVTGGQTALVPYRPELYRPPFVQMPGMGGYDFYNNREEAEKYMGKYKKAKVRKKLYDHEIRIDAGVGDILFYRLDLWHRGTPVMHGHRRHVMNLMWKKRHCMWINQWNPGWTKKMYGGMLEKLFVALSPLQRSTLGIPMPGHSYWDKETIEWLEDRYPGIDVNPYLNKL